MTQATIEEALFGAEDVALTKQQVQELPYASLYVRVNGGPQVFMVLAFVDKNPITQAEQLKWMSSDKAMIVTENGRVVKTLNLPKTNLVSLTSKSQFPFPDFRRPSYQWQAEYSWQPNYQFFQHADISTDLESKLTHSSVLWSKELTRWSETIEFPANSTSFTNYYWVDNEGAVLKSKQWVASDVQIEIEVLKQYAN